MIARNLLFSCCFLFSFAGFGQSQQQDTAYWEAFDAAMVDRIWDGIEAETGEEPTYRELFDSLKVELADRRQNGPLTTTLAYRYHWMSLFFKNFFPVEVKPYADTAIILRTEAKAPTADIAQSHYEKARVLRLLGNHQEAFVFFEEGVRIMSLAISELDTTPNLAKRQAYFLKEAAWSAGLNGNFELARLRLRQIPALLRLDISSVAPQTAFEAMMTRGNVESLAENYSTAIQYYESALETDYFQSADSINKGIAINNLGLTLLWDEQYSKAEQSLDRSLTFYESSTEWLRISTTYINLMNLRVSQERPQEALELFELAESAANKAEGSRKGIIYGELYLFAALAAEQLGQTQQIEAFFAKAASALVSNAQLFSSANTPVIEGNTIYGQSTLLEFLSGKREVFRRSYERSGDLNDLLSAHTTSFSIDTLLRLNRDQLNLTSSLGQFINKEAEEYTSAVNIALQLYQKTGSKEYLNEAYQFVAGQKSNLLRRYLTSPGLARTLGVPEGLVEEKKELELAVLMVERALQNVSQSDEATLRDSLLRLNYRASRLKNEIAENYPLFSKSLRGFKAIAPVAAASQMEADQLIVEYFLSSDSVYVFTLSRDEGLGVLTVPRPGNLTDLIGTVVNEGTGATVLYDLLVAPILTNRPNISRLQFVPDGELWELPFAALKKENDFLINDYAISYAYAVPLLFDEGLTSRARERELEYLGYGISYESLQRDLTSGLRSADYRDLREMGQLPFASKEVERAAAVIGGEFRLNEEASLLHFLQESDNARILHLSMHGLLRPNPMESALVFSGNGKNEFALLEMKDVLGGRYSTDLTVLSACHTGGGNLQTSEGMQSIGRAFTAAGSRSTITSTWEAHDQSTYEILGAFFEELKTGTPKDRALQLAIKGYLAAGTPADRRPVNWANLTLTGALAPINNSPPWVLIFSGLLVVCGVLYLSRKLWGKLL